MLWLKALHIIFVVTWFAGLFYIVRLFIYHSEAAGKPDPEREILVRQYKIMERRLWFGIAWPSAVLTWITGLAYAWQLYGMDLPGWLLLKLAFVFGLTLYHLQCHRMYVSFRMDRARHSSFSLRLWNEVATVFLFAIVFIVVLRGTVDWQWGLAGLLFISLLLMLAVYLYGKKRRN